MQEKLNKYWEKTNRIEIAVATSLESAVSSVTKFDVEAVKWFLEERLDTVAQSSSAQPVKSSSFLSFFSNMLGASGTVPNSSGVSRGRSQIERYFSSSSEPDLLDPVGW